jgi:hypothetical protein
MGAGMTQTRTGAVPIGAAVAAAAWLAADAAAACSIVPIPRTLERETGPACSASQVMEGDGVYSLSRATDLGHGIVRQMLSYSNGCASREVLLLADCRTIRAAAVPAPWFAVMEDPDTASEAAHADLMAEVELRAAAGDPVPVAEIVARAQAAGLADVAEVPARQRLRFHGWPFSLACGCALHYPELAEQGS